jgi:DNA-binding response OmpR family regulator
MPKTVLLIQDNMDCTEIMQAILEEEGLQALTPESTQEIHSLPEYDLLIVDEFSRGKTGCEICSTLKSKRDKPVLLTSTGIGLTTFSKDCNADVYLPKPFDIYTFTSIVKELLQLHSEKHGTPAL